MEVLSAFDLAQRKPEGLDTGCPSRGELALELFKIVQDRLVSGCS
jgi:hypothetical protein